MIKEDVRFDDEKVEEVRLLDVEFTPKCMMKRFSIVVTRFGSSSKFSDGGPGELEVR